MNLSTGDTRLLIDTCLKHGLLRNQAAYVLATAYHETARTMKPVRETLASTDAKAKEILTKAWRTGKLPWVKKDYWSEGWFGRGYVQLTHKANYERAGKKLGVDLVKNPSRAMEAAIAAPVIVVGMKEGWFTGHKLSDFVTLSRSNFVGARKIVNGKDRAEDIARYAREYDALLKAEGYGEKVAPVTPPVAPAKPVEPVVVVPTSDVGIPISEPTPEPVKQSKPNWSGRSALGAIGALILLGLAWLAALPCNLFGVLCQ